LALGCRHFILLYFSITFLHAAVVTRHGNSHVTQAVRHYHVTHVTSSLSWIRIQVAAMRITKYPSSDERWEMREISSMPANTQHECWLRRGITYARYVRLYARRHAAGYAAAANYDYFFFFFFFFFMVSNCREERRQRATRVTRAGGAQQYDITQRNTRHMISFLQ